MHDICIWVAFSAISDDCMLMESLAGPLCPWPQVGAAVLGVPVKPTIKEVDAHGRVVKTLRRAALWEVQTPQVCAHAPACMPATLARIASLPMCLQIIPKPRRARLLGCQRPWHVCQVDTTCMQAARVAAAYQHGA